MTGTAIVFSGSVDGLFAAANSAKGWNVEVCERARAEHSGRGTGIVTHPEPIAALNSVVASTRDLGVKVTESVALAHNAQTGRRSLGRRSSAIPGGENADGTAHHALGRDSQSRSADGGIVDREDPAQAALV